MLSNREISRALNLYAELLDLHRKDEKLSDWFAGASYRVGRLDESVFELSAKEKTAHFRPVVLKLLDELESLEFLFQALADFP